MPIGRSEFKKLLDEAFLDHIGSVANDAPITIHQVQGFVLAWHRIEEELRDRCICAHPPSQRLGKEHHGLPEGYYFCLQCQRSPRE